MATRLEGGGGKALGAGPLKTTSFAASLSYSALEVGMTCPAVYLLGRPVCLENKSNIKEYI